VLHYEDVSIDLHLKRQSAENTPTCLGVNHFFKRSELIAMALVDLIRVLALLIAFLAAVKKSWIDLLGGFSIVGFTVGISHILTELSAKYDV